MRLTIRARMDPIMAKLHVSPRGKGQKRFTTVAVYEDQSTESRVNEFCQGLSRQFGSDCEFVKQMWLLTELRLAQLRSVAAVEAAAADLVIVSVHCGSALPTEVEQWLTAWLGRKGRQSRTLLALFDPLYRGDCSGMKAYLTDVAKKGKVELLVQNEDRTDER